MRAVTWQGAQDIRVEHVPDPRIEEPTDVVIRVTSTGLCGSDLHLYEVLAPFMEPGDIVGHEPMGVVEEVGAAVRHLDVGDRVVIPFNVCCGHCWMCAPSCRASARRPRTREHGTGASLLGYSKLYGQVPGGQAEYLRVPHADYGAVKVPNGPPDDRFLFLSDVLPTAWQAVEYADVPDGGTLLVLGAGPIGDMAARIACTAAIASSWPTSCRSGCSGCPSAGPRPSTSRRSTGRSSATWSGPDRRARGRRRHRRGGHGGARVRRRQGGAEAGRACCPTGWPSR